MTESVRCLECANLKLKGCPMAPHGFGNCKFDPEWQYSSVAYRHDCARFSAAKDDVIASRVQWYDRRREGNGNAE